ncbi:hypothetical protein CARUB_v10010982mg [Capsella rubella]|uniref:DUF7086 domain-containing protein n=1 Tax=Capsella rubella TaxID=81985 RepID=R0GSK6_9BRAS|nr:uncharacterized protein LOC17899865 [Capsella rubella]EOA38771.1 hypothetical protein CARUB_v10010982mg [Capsella rubella]
MSDEHRDYDDDLNLDLSLGLHPMRRQDLMRRQDRLVPQDHQQEPVEEQSQGQGSFMQLLTSLDHPPQSIQRSPPPRDHMMSLLQDLNEDAHWFFPEQALHPLHQLNQVRTAPMETRVSAPQHPRPRRGRPPGAQARLNPTNTDAVEKKVIREIVPPYPWSTNKPCVVHTISDLIAMNINMIHGQVYCKPCNKTHTLYYNLIERFSELSVYVKANMEIMRLRAPARWLNPTLTQCVTCKTDMKPLLNNERMEEINWLFLMLGGMLGCCTLDQLKFFCQANGKHRTGCKDRVLYTTYLRQCEQLDPEGPFHVE